MSAKKNAIRKSEWRFSVMCSASRNVMRPLGVMLASQ